MTAMIVNAWVTATRVEWSDDGSEDYTEQHGWIDWSYDHHELEESRNYVRPVATWNDRDDDDREDFPTVEDFIRGTVADILGSAEDNGDGTWYGQDEHMCNVTLQDGSSWSYALHFTTKRYDWRQGWVEDPVT